MKNLITFLSFYLLSINLSAQCHPNASQYLNVNNVKTAILNGGDLWWDLYDGQYVFPYNGIQNTHALFAGAVWMGAKDNFGNIYTAGQTFRSDGDTDYYPGTGGNCNEFNKIWKLESSHVMAHLNDFSDNGTIDNPNAYIYSWPGKDNPHSSTYNGFALPPGKILAPFVDVNHDGIYNPDNGDYPDVKGDQILWWVFNDFEGTHQVTGTQPLNVEVQAMAYAFASTNTNLNNSTFYSFTIINQGNQDLFDFYWGLWVDPDLGCPIDDYVGCRVSNDLAFIYNSTNFDANNCTGAGNGVFGYNANIPMIGIDLLKGLNDNQGNNLGLSSFTVFGDDASTQGLPNNGLEYYRYLSGTWRDGFPLTKGGTGKGGTTPYPYMYDGNPALFSEWSECSVNNSGGDRRFLMSSGPILFSPNEVQRVDFAVIGIENVTHPCPNVSAITLASNDIQNHFDNNIISNTDNLKTEKSLSLSLQPNPFNDIGILDLSALSETVTVVKIFDGNGRLIKNILPTDKQIEIHRNNLSTGLYFFQILTISNKSYTGKFVISD